MKKRICWECQGRMAEKFGEYEPGFNYRYWKCKKCGEEILDTKQLQDAAYRWKKFVKIPKATISRWGTTLAMRIPKEVAEKQKIRVGKKVLIFPEKYGFKVIPERE